MTVALVTVVTVPMVESVDVVTRWVPVPEAPGPTLIVAPLTFFWFTSCVPEGVIDAPVHTFPVVSIVTGLFVLAV